MASVLEDSSSYCKTRSFVFAHLCDDEYFSSQLKERPLDFQSCITLKLNLLYTGIMVLEFVHLSHIFLQIACLV